MNRFALLIECDEGNTLGGSCLRDIENMARCLIEHNFQPSNVYLLTTSSYKPKTPGIVHGQSKDLFKIFQQINALEPSFLVVLLSGHGYSVADRNGDEVDGADEAVHINGQVLDDDIYNNIVTKMKCDGLLLSDTCHSGTMFDLPFVYNNGTKQFTKQTKRNDNFKARVISLSACSDQQLSMCDVGDNTGFGGSLTTAVLNIDGVLGDLLKRGDLIGVYNKIQTRLQMLNQTLILSATIG